VLRDGKRLPMTVTLADRSELRFAQGPGQPERSAQPDEAVAAGQSGLRVRELTVAERRQAGVESGVLVVEVAEGSPAEEAGFSANDIIEKVGGKPVSDTDAFAHALKEASTKGKPAALLVRRGSVSRFLALRVGN